MLMNIQAMLLPHKHVRFCNSLIAIAGYIRTLIDGPVSIEELWTKVERKSKSTIITPSLTQFMLAVDILFCIKQITLDNENRIMPICSIDDKLQNKES
ncbi:ABC-three component system middle component 6 [Enterobacter roggenkampii]|uniref:ABC-three component system middle component 6 n=1 Tax=Enterobacter roggenkampii TaxID=1812935 RepID=UPI003D69579F